VAALPEMYVQGVSTRKVKAITEELCGHNFSAAAIGSINVKLDAELAGFARGRLDEPCHYLIVDARYERVREAGVIRSRAVLLAIGIRWDGRRSILAVELANRESRSSWRDFLLGLRERSPAHGGVKLIRLPCGQRCALPTRGHHRHHDPFCRRFWTHLGAASEQPAGLALSTLSHRAQSSSPACNPPPIDGWWSIQHDSRPAGRAAL
jgi:hypothetical protein